MARSLLPLLCATVALLLPWVAADNVPARCSHPKDVANAHIDVGNNTLLNARLRYTCNPGYKRKAGTSSLIQCILHDGASKPDWTHTTLQCIRDPALPPLTPSPELPTAPQTEKTTQRAAGWESPVPPAPDGPSPWTSMPPEMIPPLETSTPGEGTTPGTSLGTTPLPTTTMDHAAVFQTLASSIVFPVLVVAGVVACCCWRMRTRAVQDYPVTAIPMVAAENEEMLPPNVFPMG